MRSPNAKSWLKRRLHYMRYPVVTALVAGLLLSLIVIQMLESKLEADGRIKMQAALVLIKANLSVETVRAKGMGVAGAKAHDLDELNKQLTYAMSTKGPYLIDVVM